MDGVSDYEPPQIVELPAVLALAGADDEGGDSDDSNSSDTYLKRPAQVWGGASAGLSVRRRRWFTRPGR
ncbi:hypothetical protein ACFZBU_43525 [Embleya sp. NPDC008237]|uniref:hypothetical protein n=1 Tax=Embleya sp. NPDC008237 TaxID=3363978 RepID=UPI0036E6DBE7